MWIIDSCYRDGVDLWEKGDRVEGRHIPYDPSFYLHLPDPHAYHEMLEALAARYPLEECRFRTVYGELDGYRIMAGREVAGIIEQQTGYAAQLYNVDIRLDQRFMAEQGIFPCGSPGDSRFTAEFDSPLTGMEIVVKGNPFVGQGISCIEAVHERRELLEGPEKVVLIDLFALLETCDPDVILFPGADIWMVRILQKSRRYGLDNSLSRTGRFRKLEARSYWSYGRTEYREGALIPDGRVLIDTTQSFNYREGGLFGVFFASRLTGLCPNLAARFTSGTLISTYEIYEAVRSGIAVPYRKSEPEVVRRFYELKKADRGGMMFQPMPGLYEQAYQIDYTSLYPSVIVQSNLSPETFLNPSQQGFLPAVLAPLLALRIETKRRKKQDPRFEGIDAILKWMLVTCFGYTGYKNAKFGRIEVHEQITGRSRDILIRTKDIAEEMGFDVLHGIVDCLWVRGGRTTVRELEERVEQDVHLPTEIEAYHWIVFLPLPDGFGAYNRYYGLLTDGSVKMRGVAARRGDTPDYVRKVQQDLLSLVKTAETRSEIAGIADKVRERYLEAVAGLRTAEAREMAIHRQVSQLEYAHRCSEASAVKACQAAGIEVSPGMEISYVVTDARRWAVVLDWQAESFDAAYYQTLLERAWTEISFALEQASGDGVGEGREQKFK